MIVVSDPSAITALIQIGRVDLLFEIFEGVVIPVAVADELAVSHVELPPWVKIMHVRNPQSVEKLREQLDTGESEAIVLAVELDADFLLIDEKLGRSVAK